MTERVRGSLVMTARRDFAAVKLGQGESCARVVLTRDAGWSRSDQRVQVRIVVKFRDGSAQEFLSGVRTGQARRHHLTGVQMPESVFSVRFRKAGPKGETIPDDSIDDISVSVEPVQGSPTIDARLETM